MSTGRLTGNFPQAQETLRNDAVQLRDEVAAFCRRKGLLAYLQMAADLVKKLFQSQGDRF